MRAGSLVVNRSTGERTGVRSRHPDHRPGSRHNRRDRPEQVPSRLKPRWDFRVGSGGIWPTARSARDNTTRKSRGNRAQAARTRRDAEGRTLCYFAALSWISAAAWRLLG